MANPQSSNRPQGNQSRQPGNQSSQAAAGATETMVRNESGPQEPSPPATHVDEVTALRDQVAELTAMVRQLALAGGGRPIERMGIDDVRRAMYDDDREMRMTKRRLAQERAEQRNREYSELLRDSELSLQEGDLKFRVEIPGEPRSMRLVGAINAFTARGRYETHMGIITVIDPAKSIRVTPLDESELPVVQKEVLKYVRALAA